MMTGSRNTVRGLHAVDLQSNATWSIREYSCECAPRSAANLIGVITGVTIREFNLVASHGELNRLIAERIVSVSGRNISQNIEMGLPGLQQIERDNGSGGRLSAA